MSEQWALVKVACSWRRFKVAMPMAWLVGGVDRYDAETMDRSAAEQRGDFTLAPGSVRVTGTDLTSYFAAVSDLHLLHDEGYISGEHAVEALGEGETT